MESKGCEYCRDWSHGRPESIEELAVIVVLMSCGCGGEVKHSILRCRKCNSPYLSSYFDHKAFHSDNYEVSSISREEAQKLIQDISQCETPENPLCRCEIHKRYEFIRIGEIIYSEEIPD